MRVASLTIVGVVVVVVVDVVVVGKLIDVVVDAALSAFAVVAAAALAVRLLDASVIAATSPPTPTCSTAVGADDVTYSATSVTPLAVASSDAVVVAFVAAAAAAIDDGDVTTMAAAALALALCAGVGLLTGFNKLCQCRSVNAKRTIKNENMKQTR